MKKKLSNLDLLARYEQELHAILGIYLTNKCNIKCRHCCVNSGPKETSKLVIDEILSQINILAGENLIKFLHISGGEPFLYREDLRRIASEGQKYGLGVGVNTNSFWAPSHEKAVNILKNLDGITHLFVSADVYHEEFIPLSRVLNSITAGLEIGLGVVLHISTPGGKRNKFVSRVESLLPPDAPDRIIIQLHSVEPGGRADNLPEAYWRNMSRDRPAGACSLINRPTVLEDGTVLACCNTTVMPTCSKSLLDLGNIKKEALKTILERSDKDPFVMAMKYLGPDFVSRLLSDKHQKILDKEYRADDICGLCVDLMSRPDLVRSIKEGLKGARTQKMLSAVTLLNG